jgi:hypothetical protein
MPILRAFDASHNSVKTKLQRLARQLLDWKPLARVDAPECFTCGRGYHRGDGRFCSPRCRHGFDDGFSPYERREIIYSMPKSGDGFRIECANCKRPFTSKGLRCCSTECERIFRQREERKRDLADIPFRSPRPPCESCGGPIPKWRKGRLVSNATRFCSPRCQKRKRSDLGLRRQNQLSGAQTAKKCPHNGPSE